MTFLAKLGKALLQGLGIVNFISETGLVKFPGQTAQVISRDLAEMAKIVTGIEADQALAIEAVQIRQIVLSSALVAGKKIGDEAELQLACEGFANAVAHLYKAIHPDEVKVVEPQDLA